MLEVTKGNFVSEVMGCEKLVMVDFWATWCMPCKIIAPAVEEIAKEMFDKVRVGKSNVDDNPDLATELSVMNIPTLVFFKGGMEVGRMVGVNSKEAIAAKINKLI
jgi:thioredoxin 1